MEAHHVLPQKFLSQFEAVKIDIHNPIFGAWVDTTTHHKWSYAYNKAWEDFVDKNNNYTTEEVIKFARELAQKYEFDILF